MKTVSSVKTSATARVESKALRCTIEVDPTHIDFLTEGSVFAAGSGAGDCSSVSPLPLPPAKGSRRRRSDDQR